MSKQVVFAGTPQIAATQLQALLGTEYQPTLVLTQPDRKSGRGRKLQASPVKQLAMDNDIEVYQPANLRASEHADYIAQFKPEVMIVVAYGCILPEAILKLPRLGCINIHVSLLPKWRGASPIAHAILEGDDQTGITYMQMDQGLDTGAILQQITASIMPDDTTQTLTERLAQVSAQNLRPFLDQLFACEITAKPQDNVQASYAHKFSKEDGKINWAETAVQIDRKIRAFNPWPVAHSTINGIPVRLWQTSVLNTTSQHPSGTIIATNKKGIEVSAGSNTVLQIQMAQLPGAKANPAHALLNSNQNPFVAGQQFD